MYNKAGYMVLVLLIIFSGAFPVSGITYDESILSTSLREELEGFPAYIEVVVHFDDKVSGHDYELLRSVGLNPLYTFEFINVVYATGNYKSVLRATNLQGIHYIEHNVLLTYNMEVSNEAIRATEVWNTIIRNEQGDIYDGIDGTGVTAVIVDQGVDAAHPDLLLGEKTIINLQMAGLNQYNWIEVVNGDNGGHGTHVAGTVAGSGLASAGARKGVAPGADIIGLSVSYLYFIWGLAGLEWTYENSRPGNNPHNIRVVVNSWGSYEEYNFNNAINKAIRKITYENNVVVTFAAGNDGGEGNERRTGSYSIEPAAICVAAAVRDGNGMAKFSSRGDKNDDFTWPDVAAPGVGIMAARARRASLSTMIGFDDVYYQRMSGTSMANPHVGGLVALLWQACPSLRVSDISDDNSKAGSEFHNSPDTRMHESEIILKLTSRFLEGAEGIPDTNKIGVLGRHFDFAQGYGVVDAAAAVGLALTLNELRKTDVNITVFEAYDVFMNNTVSESVIIEKKTDAVTASWEGFWGQFTDFFSISTDATRRVFVPSGAARIIVDFSYNNLNVDNGITAGNLELVVNTGTGIHRINGKKTIDVSRSGWWDFHVEGMAVSFSGVSLLKEFNEALIRYSVSLRMEFSSDIVEISPQDFRGRTVQWEFMKTDGEPAVTVRMHTRSFNMAEVSLSHRPTDTASDVCYIYLIIIFIIILILVIILVLMKKGKIKSFSFKGSYGKLSSFKERGSSKVNYFKKRLGNKITSFKSNKSSSVDAKEA